MARALEEHIIALQDTVAHLEHMLEALTTPPETCAELPLPKSKQRIFSILRNNLGKVVSNEQLFAGLYWDRPDKCDRINPEITKVFVCHTRAAIAAACLPLRIDTVWGVGYKMVDTAAEAAASTIKRVDEHGAYDRDGDAVIAWGDV
jgi:DNA-binding response OmpR family regulator